MTSQALLSAFVAGLRQQSGYEWFTTKQGIKDIYQKTWNNPLNEFIRTCSEMSFRNKCTIVISILSCETVIQIESSRNNCKIQKFWSFLGILSDTRLSISSAEKMAPKHLLKIV